MHERWRRGFSLARFAVLAALDALTATDKTLQTR
jgi:hypothetical protein